MKFINIIFIIVYMERIYTYRNEPQRDAEEIKQDITSAIEKLPAFVELMKFIYEGSKGLNVEIKGKSIDDAFDCIIDRNKVFIKTSNLSKRDKENEINRMECELKLMKEAFKDSLKLKISY